MRTVVCILCFNILVIFGALSAAAQQSVTSGSTIESTTKFIEDKVNGEGSLSYHQEINHPAGGHYDQGQSDTYSPRLSAKPLECTMGPSLNFKVVKSVRVMSATEDYAEGKEGRDGWVATIRPNYYVVVVESSSGARHVELDFRQMDSANQVRDAILHAVDLCGSDKVLSSPASVSQTSASNITIEQTIDFINKSFATEGAFDYSDGTERGINVRYCCMVETISYQQKISSQSVAIQGSQLTYSRKGVRVSKDESPVLNNKGDIAKGHNIVEHSGAKAIMTEKPADLQIAIELGTTKALAVEVHVNDVHVWTYSSAGEEWKTQDTTPATYSVVIVVPPADVRGYAVTQLVGTFFDEDHANRAAKAYSHAIDLLHKHEDKVPSIF